MSRQFRPSDLEMQVLSVLWDKGPLPVRKVLELLPDGKKRAYTTVMTVMQIMEKKGLLDHRREGLAHVYNPKVKPGQVLRPMMRDLLRNLFGGRASAALQHLLPEADVNAEELKEIHKLLAEYETKGPAKEDRR